MRFMLHMHPLLPCHSGSATAFALSPVHQGPDILPDQHLFLHGILEKMEALNPGDPEIGSKHASPLLLKP